VDSRLDDLEKKTGNDQAELIRSLKGKAGIASGKLAYVDYQETFLEESAFEKLKAEGAKEQRALWASTSTKNPAYPDTMYVENLIGPNTVNTIPPKTLKAFLDHGRVDRTIDSELDLARKVFSDLESLGVDMVQVTDELESEGVKAFADSFTALLDSLGQRMEDLG
jgi:transaldolase